jgi:hypothetical protein
MDCFPHFLNQRGTISASCWLFVVVIVIAVAAPSSVLAQRQIRTKKPDRGVYQPPTAHSRTASRAETQSAEQRPHARRQIVDADLVNATPMPKTRSENRSRRDATTRSAAARTQTRIRQTNLSEPVFNAPVLEDTPVVNGEVVDGEFIVESYPHDLNAIDMGTLQPGCGVEALGCDSCGCDSIGCARSCTGNRACSRGCGSCLPKPNGYISFSPDRWFGSIELMLMFRSGDRPPTLLTTGPSTDADTAGEIGQAGTQVVVGGDRIFEDLTAGGRLTLGTYLDSQQCRSLILRGWIAGEDTFGFSRDQNSLAVITRPFEDVSDNQAAQQDTLLVAFPDRATGSISIRGDSNVYGADISVRQFWYGIEGFSLDFLYGYQFMRLDENLAIQSTSLSLDDDFAPVGSTISISDSFDVENEFHGGQIGVASMYREGCWSLSTLAKLGFGSLARRGDLQGETRTSIDGNSAVDNQGLLVRDTNSGKREDHTFGLVPEIDLTLGWRKFPNYEVTVGYHITAMSDALQVSGAIDPALAVNLSDPATGRQNPRRRFHYETFYVQGIHFGLQYVY